MSLRSFHLFFIAISIVLAAFVAAWAGAQYRTVHDNTYLLGAWACIGAAIALMTYAAAFQRKTRRL